MSRVSSLLFCLCGACAAAPLDPASQPDVVEAAPALDVAPPPPLYALNLTTPVPGDTMSVTVHGVPVGAQVELYGGTQRGRGACGHGTCVDIRRPYLIGSSSSSGSVTFEVDVPGVWVGTQLLFQAKVIEGGAARRSFLSARRASEPLALVGTWEDDFASEHVIDNRTWYNFGTFEILTFSNATGTVLALNGADTFFPDTFSRFDFVDDGASGIWYCQSAYNAVDYATAWSTTPADDTDPAAGGCGAAFPGGFAWSHLTLAP